MNDKIVIIEPIKIASWVPEPVKNYYHQQLQYINRWEESYYKRLKIILSHPRMENVWKKLQRITNKAQEIEFFALLIVETPGYWKQYIKPYDVRYNISYAREETPTHIRVGLVSNLSKGKYNKNEHFKKIAKVAEKLADYLYGIKYPFVRELTLKYPEFSDLREALNNLTSVAKSFKAGNIRTENLIFPEAANFRKTNVKHAEVIYFIRVLSAFCWRAFKRPLTPQVAEITRLVFGTDKFKITIDESYIKRLTADLVTPQKKVG